jgi:hypothetical protein
LNLGKLGPYAQYSLMNVRLCSQGLWKQWHQLWQKRPKTLVLYMELQRFPTSTICFGPEFMAVHNARRQRLTRRDTDAFVKNTLYAIKMQAWEALAIYHCHARNQRHNASLQDYDIMLRAALEADAPAALYTMLKTRTHQRKTRTLSWRQKIDLLNLELPLVEPFPSKCMQEVLRQLKSGLLAQPEQLILRARSIEAYWPTVPAEHALLLLQVSHIFNTMNMDLSMIKRYEELGSAPREFCVALLNHLRPVQIPSWDALIERLEKEAHQ